MTGNPLAKQFVDAAHRVHTTLGRALLALLATRQQPVPMVYDGGPIEVGFRADLIVEDLVIVGSNRSRWRRRCTRSSFYREILFS